METKTVTRAFRLPEELDAEVVKKAKEMGYLSPSEYLRDVVRSELKKETQ